MLSRVRSTPTSLPDKLDGKLSQTAYMLGAELLLLVNRRYCARLLFRCSPLWARRTATEMALITLLDLVDVVTRAWCCVWRNRCS